MKQIVLILLLAGGVKGISYAEPRFSPEKPEGDSLSMMPSVREMFGQIISITGTHVPLYLKEANVLNLEASVVHRKKYISYNPAYIKWITTVTDDKWAALTLLAHEVGHQLKGHTSGKKGNRLQCELEADEFAGSVLYKLGATLEETQEVMKIIAAKEDSDTHPAQASRLLALKKGWSNAENEKNTAALLKRP